MEEAAPPDAGSGGTPTAMVAVPMLSTALGQRFTMLGGTGVGTKMEASIHLRAKDFAAHERWLANLADVITSNGLDDLWENQQLPTREAVARQFTDKTSEQQQELFGRAMQQWQSENTRLYFLVKDSVVISGDWEALDRETIKERFTSGRLRDGVAFVQWVNSYHDHRIECIGTRGARTIGLDRAASGNCRRRCWTR